MAHMFGLLKQSA